MSQSDIFYSINNIQFRAVYDDQTKAFTPYTKIDGGTFTLNVSDIQIGAIEIKDGTTDDRAHVTPGGLLAVDASGAVVPISATALPLPSGAATSANQTSVISAIGNTNTALGLQAKLTSHNFYKDGRSAERETKRRAEMNTLDYRLWREKVFARDNWTCLLCKERGGELHADHIEAWAVSPAKRYAVSNGRTLCAPCHRKTPNYGSKALPSAIQETDME